MGLYQRRICRLLEKRATQAQAEATALIILRAKQLMSMVKHGRVKDDSASRDSSLLVEQSRFDDPAIVFLTHSAKSYHDDQASTHTHIPTDGSTCYHVHHTQGAISSR